MLNILSDSLLIATRTENLQSQKYCDWGTQNKPVNSYFFVHILEISDQFLHWMNQRFTYLIAFRSY